MRQEGCINDTGGCLNETAPLSQGYILITNQITNISETHHTFIISAFMFFFVLKVYD